MRLALKPNHFIATNAQSIENGITTATMRPRRGVAQENSQSSATTSAPPSSRFFSMVCVVRPTSSVWS